MLNGIDKDTLARVSEEIWSSMLGITISPTDQVPSLGRKVTACVQIMGVWDGAVRLDCSEAMARLAASCFMGTEPKEVTRDQIRDAAGELANMTGGNLKLLLPKPSSLTLPSVADGENFNMTIPHSTLVLESAFTCDSGSLIVSVFERDNQG